MSTIDASGSRDANPRTGFISGAIGGLGSATCIALARAVCRVMALDLERQLAVDISPVNG